MSGCHGRISMHVMKLSLSSPEISSIRKCHRPLRKKGGVKRLADEDVSVPRGGVTSVAAPNVSPDDFLSRGPDA